MIMKTTTQKKEVEREGRPPLCLTSLYFTLLSFDLIFFGKLVTSVKFNSMSQKRRKGSSTPKEGGESSTTKRRRRPGRIGREFNFS